MTRTTRQQREALWRLFCRQYDTSYEPRRMLLRRYRAFRRTVLPEIGGPAIMVRWASMWIGIEPDGYAHS